MAETAKEMLERMRAKRGQVTDAAPSDESAADMLARLRSGTVAKGRIVRDESGSVLGNVPQEVPPPPQPKPTKGQAFRNRFAEEAINTATGAGRVMTETAMRTNPILSSLMNAKDAYENVGSEPPAPLGVLNLPKMPSGRETVAGAKVLGNKAMGLLGPVDELNMGSAIERQNEIESAEPFASELGGLLEDTGTLVAGRLPFIKQTGKEAGGLFDDLIKKQMSRTALKLRSPKGFSGQARQWLENDVVQNVAKATGRSLETGLEGAALEILQGGDPVEIGAWTAGGQLASSAGLTAAKFSTSLGIEPYEKHVPLPIRMAVSAAVAGSMIQFFKSATPGGDDYSLESTEAGYNKVLYGVLAGVAALGGKRSKAEGVLSNFPVIADAAWTLPRTAMIATAKKVAEATRDGDPRAEKVVTLMLSQPDAFTPKTQEKLRRVMEDPESSLPATVARLYRTDSKFRDTLDAPHPGLVGVPVKETE